MSFGSLEVASIPRTQDYTTMKQNEDNKGAFQQMTLGEHAQKQSEQRTREVHSSDNADWYTGQYDAKEKGKNEYAGNGGKHRKKENSEKDGRNSIRDLTLRSENTKEKQYGYIRSGSADRRNRNIYRKFFIAFRKRKRNQ